MAEIALIASAGTLLTGTATAATVATGVATAISVLSSVAGTMSQVQATRDEAKLADLQGGQERVDSVARQTQMKRELLRIMGENDVSFAAGGTSTGQGIALDAARQATQRTQEQLSIDRRNAEFRRALYRARAHGLRRRANTELFTGLAGAAAQGISGVASMGQLGAPGGGGTSYPSTALI